MQRLCRNGLHEKDYPGYCVECRRAYRKRYRQSENGKAAQKAAQERYAHSPKGVAAVKRRDERRYRKCREAGMCVKCPEQAVPGEARCVMCRAKKREYSFMHPS